MKVITTHKQAIENIVQFNKEVNSFLLDEADSAIGTLVNNIPHYRAWYSFYDEASRDYLFAPSKYVGYTKINAQTYEEKHQTGLDGRQTESALSAWYETISDSHEEYELLSKQLREFCSKFDKKPNSLYRINIPYVKPVEANLEDSVVDFIWNAYQRLSLESRSKLKSKINRYKD